MGGNEGENDSKIKLFVTDGINFSWQTHYSIFSWMFEGWDNIHSGQTPLKFPCIISIISFSTTSNDIFSSNPFSPLIASITIYEGHSLVFRSQKKTIICDLSFHQHMPPLLSVTFPGEEQSNLQRNIPCFLRRDGTLCPKPFIPSSYRIKNPYLGHCRRPNFRSMDSTYHSILQLTML